MFNIIKEINKEATLSSIIYIIIGMILFFVPKLSADLIIGAISLIIFMFGISRLISYFRYNKIGFNERLDLIIGAISLGISVFIIFNSTFIMSIIPFITGFFLLTEALHLVKQAYVLKDLYIKQFKVSLILSLILALAGIYLLFNPIKVITSLIAFIGILLICMGSFELWTSYQVQKLIK
ncbi:MAG: DUF308 domain-containing protein [Erysipelotrichaceae bacterium]|nr:DUF308 domain-containing protein [Erysipelotrichaceae bacterium]